MIRKLIEGIVQKVKNGSLATESNTVVNGLDIVRIYMNIREVFYEMDNFDVEKDYRIITLKEDDCNVVLLTTIEYVLLQFYIKSKK